MKELTPSRPLLPWFTKDLTTRREIRSPLDYLEGERGIAHIFWQPLHIPWAEVGVAAYSTSWMLRGKCEVAGPPGLGVLTTLRRHGHIYDVMIVGNARPS